MHTNNGIVKRERTRKKRAKRRNKKKRWKGKERKRKWKNKAMVISPYEHGHVWYILGDSPLNF